MNRKTTIVNLVSRLDHPVTISYNGESVIIPPRGKAEKLMLNRIGAIPKGIVKIRVK